MNTLHDYHHHHARDFISLGGYALPLLYQTPQKEFAATQTVAMMDMSFLGKLFVSGKDREALLHRLTTNEMRKLAPGKSRVNVFINAKGRVVDRFEMLAEEERYLLLTSAGRDETLRQWIEKYTFIEDVKISNVTHEFAIIALFGSESATRLQAQLGFAASNLSAGSFFKQKINEYELYIHRPESSSPAQLQLIIPSASALALWQTLTAAFAPIGYETFETLRILAGIPMAEHELTEEYNPHEVGLYSLINFEKGCYIGQEVVARLDTYQKVQRQLMGVKLDAEPRACTGATLWLEQEEMGKITSIAHAPEGNGAIGLALVRKQSAQLKARVDARAKDGESLHATLVQLPFETGSSFNEV
jgi:folate-binding protein YgfZ